MKLGFDVFSEDDGLLGTYDFDDTVAKLDSFGPHHDSHAVVHGTNFAAGTGKDMATKHEIIAYMKRRIDAMNHYNGLDEMIGKAPKHNPKDATIALERTKKRDNDSEQWQQDCLNDGLCAVCLTDISSENLQAIPLCDDCWNESLSITAYNNRRI